MKRSRFSSDKKGFNFSESSSKLVNSRFLPFLNKEIKKNGYTNIKSKNIKDIDEDNSIIILYSEEEGIKHFKVNIIDEKMSQKLVNFRIEPKRKSSLESINGFKDLVSLTKENDRICMHVFLKEEKMMLLETYPIYESTPTFDSGRSFRKKDKIIKSIGCLVIMNKEDKKIFNLLDPHDNFLILLDLRKEKIMITKYVSFESPELISRFICLSLTQTFEDASVIILNESCEEILDMKIINKLHKFVMRDDRSKICCDFFKESLSNYIKLLKSEPGGDTIIFKGKGVDIKIFIFKTFYKSDTFWAVVLTVMEYHKQIALSLLI